MIMMANKRGNVYIIVLLCLFAFTVTGFHGPELIDCWTLDANENNEMEELVDCEGLALEWIEPPPDEIEKGEECNVSYSAAASNTFYTLMPGFSTNRSEDEFREFCENKSCPGIPVPLLRHTDCCVWHANVHTCHPTDTVPRPVCGPWIMSDGRLSTHTASLAGTILTEFSAAVQFNFIGINYVIAHLRVGRRQIAIEKQVRVKAKLVCGDDICSSEIGETCDTCETDCCIFIFPVGAIAAIVIFVALIPIVIFVVALGCFFHHRRKMFLDESWIINYEDLKKDSDFRGLMGSLASLKQFKFMSPQDDNVSGGDLSLHSVKRRQIFTQTAIYDGQAVAIKKVPRQDFVLNNTIRREVLQTRMIDHTNLCKFIGATVKDPGNVHIITEYCPKGSLNDVLQNDDIPLNWAFRLSFATDIARGMAYLHSKRMYHCRLTSSNCTIDDRWVLKISDFGLPSFRDLDSQEKGSIGGRSSVIKIYMPPEIRGSHDTTPAPTTDVYSYAIILVEIATRVDPYSEELFVDTNWKPRVSSADLSDPECPCPQDYLDLIHRCWAFSPHTRPSFDSVKKTLYRINPNKESAVDNMMFMMEKYSKHLEVLVSERTKELMDEQERAATLLYSMLPQQVADDLKKGKPTGAQNFQSATIFFSDIKGFTSLASISTPMQIVKLLNDLYSTFDSILDNFDVYKVETIGDAYMVVSGVPKENGIQHAAEIGSMALELVKTCEHFRIPHLPDTKLEIRAGVHSGPVCAGVVGQKMPRYCLFGDTVNTASRMEATSEAMKIQCSDACVQLLKKLGGFRLESRGSIPIKGKGTMVTWWLLGKDRISSDSLAPRPVSRNTHSSSGVKRSMTDIVRVTTHEHVPSGRRKTTREESGRINSPKVLVQLPGTVVCVEEIH